MTLPLGTDYAPMEAATAEEIPGGEGWLYEPKWDGFRCLAFRDEDSVELQSKSGQPLARYFPEVVAALRALPTKRFIVDGELVVRTNGEPDFDALLQRVHPAQSRIERLSRETPAALLLFDILADARGRDLTGLTLAERRERLEAFAGKWLDGDGMIRLSPATTSVREAARWLEGHTGTDGVMAKRLDRPYATGERTAMRKIKRMRTADCVVGGYRLASRGGAIGSLLLGLYDDDGLLHHVGFSSSFNAADRARLAEKVTPLAGGEGFTGRAPGGPSRWSNSRSSEWTPLRHELVVEVQYDHVTNDRFRHGTRFLRWRPDKAPAQCLLSQIAPRRAKRARRSA